MYHLGYLNFFRNTLLERRTYIDAGRHTGRHTYIHTYIHLLKKIYEFIKETNLLQLIDQKNFILEDCGYI